MAAWEPGLADLRRETVQGGTVKTSHVGETPGVGDGQGGLACCDSWGRKESAKGKALQPAQGQSRQDGAVICIN